MQVAPPNGNMVILKDYVRSGDGGDGFIMQKEKSERAGDIFQITGAQYLFKHIFLVRTMQRKQKTINHFFFLRVLSLIS